MIHPSEKMLYNIRKIIEIMPINWTDINNAAIMETKTWAHQ